MTHFVIVVITPKGKDDDETISQLLHPYDESLVVAEYDHKCNCGEYKARAFAREQTKAHFGKDFAKLREEFYQKSEILALKKLYEDDYYTWDKQVDPLWKAHIKEYTEYEERMKQSADNSPDRECDECFGTGFYRSTYNPKSKWDWYALGGRWSCSIPENKCSTDEFMDLWGRQTKYVPSTIVTPDGEWHEEHSHGWFGSTYDEKMSEEQWKETFEKTLKAYPDHVAVLVDCHI